MKKTGLFLIAFLIGTTSLFAQMQDPQTQTPGGEIPEKQDEMNRPPETFGDQGGGVPCPPGAFDDKRGSGLDDTKGRGRRTVPPENPDQGASESAPDQQTDRFSNCPPSSTDKGGGLDQPSQRFDKDVPGGPIEPGTPNAPTEPPPLLPPAGIQ